MYNNIAIYSKFTDVVVLDVVPLDICILVLGSPINMTKKPYFIVRKISIIFSRTRLNILLELSKLELMNL